MYVPVPGGVEVALLHLSAGAGSDRLADELSERALQHVLPSALPQDDQPGELTQPNIVPATLTQLTFPIVRPLCMSTSSLGT